MILSPGLDRFRAEVPTALSGSPPPALRDIGGVVRGKPATTPAGGRPVTAESRLLAMAMLQETRPGLSHTALVGVVDAAARWIEEDEHDFALGVGEAAAGERTAPDTDVGSLLMKSRISPADTGLDEFRWCVSFVTVGESAKGASGAGWGLRK